MPLRVTKEVIDGDCIVRCNGNNSTGSRATGDGGSAYSGVKKAPRWVQKKIAKIQGAREATRELRRRANG